MTSQASGRVFLINKPYRWTSFDVVKKLRNSLGIKKVGHAGTLDPLATGLLILCTGKETKNIEKYQALEKEYTTTFVLGKTTESFDLEREIIDVADPSAVTREEVEDACRRLSGDILQVPPAHSAIKKDGKRVYESARKGIDVSLPARPVTVSLFEVTKYDLPEIHCRIVCSQGTYIRSLARDLGLHLKVGAYVSALTRTRIGHFKLENAMDLPDLIETLKAERNADL